MDLSFLDFDSISLFVCLGGWLDGMISAIAQGVSDTVNLGYDNYKTGREHAFAVRQQDDAQNFTREQMQNKHQWQVADLKAAGLNPVLSAHSGSQIGSSPVTTGNSVNTGRMVDLSSALLAYKQGKMYEEQADRLKAETQNIAKQTALTDSNAKAAKVRAELVQKYYDSMTPQQRADAGNSLVNGKTVATELGSAHQMIKNWLNPAFGAVSDGFSWMNNNPPQKLLFEGVNKVFNGSNNNPNNNKNNNPGDKPAYVPGRGDGRKHISNKKNRYGW